MELFVVNHAELTGRHTLHPTVGFYMIDRLASSLLSRLQKSQLSIEIVGGMPNLERHPLGQRLQHSIVTHYGRKEMEIAEGKLLHMRLDGFVAFHHI